MTTHGKRHAKQDIMDAAWKLFTEQGYDETTIAQMPKSSIRVLGLAALALGLFLVWLARSA